MPMYMKIDGIDGEAQSAGRRKWIDVLSFSIAVERPDSGGVRDRGNAEFGPLVVTKAVDVSTTDVLFAAAAGVAIPTVRLNVTRNGEEREINYYDVNLTNVRIMGVATTGPAGDDSVFEEVTFNYEEIEWSYHRINAKGQTYAKSNSWRIETAEV